MPSSVRCLSVTPIQIGPSSSLAIESGVGVIFITEMFVVFLSLKNGVAVVVVGLLFLGFFLGGKCVCVCVGGGGSGGLLPIA